MGCATSLVKIIVFIFNFLFALCGLALLIVGVLILKNVKDYDFLGGKFSAPPILLIVVGSVIFVVAFFGFCGALKGSHCMLCTYVVLLLTIFVVQVVVGALAFAYRDDTEDMVLESIDKYVAEYSKYQKTMDSIQINLKCCGADGPRDYGKVISNMLQLPNSCCKKGHSTCLYNPLPVPDKSYYTVGCKDALKDFINTQGIIIGAVAIGVAGVEIVGIIFGLCLANSVKNAERRSRG